jgi:hypothetical protein
MTSVFTKTQNKMLDTIDVTLQFTGWLVGGCPKDPKLVEGWLRKNLGVDDETELRQQALIHLREMGVEVAADAEWSDIVDASESIAGEKQTQGFKVDAEGRPYIEARQIKAGIKESVHILFAGDKWGKTKKGPKSFVAERVFVKPDAIAVGDAITGVHFHVGHITGPRGPQATVGYAEYVDQPEISFSIRALEDAISDDKWAQIWAHMELNGLGAMRSQGFGQFEVVEWKKV